jgi:hypothetical protein
MFLQFVFYRPDGGCRSWDGWTAGSHQLGDDVDRQALAAGMDAVDWFEISGRHVQTSSAAGWRSAPIRCARSWLMYKPESVGTTTMRARLWKVVTGYCDHYGQPHPPAERRIPWMGFGPTLRTKQR